MYSKYMINTYSESSLHRTLKTIYAVKNNGVTEVTIKHKICDIFTESGDIIEIQTQHISALKAKLEALLNEYQITIIRPLVQEKYIETYDTAHKLIRRRKSPKKETLYSIYRELTGIHPFIGHHNLILEIPCITVCEIREEKNYPIQLKNKSRRFLHCWEKKDKKLEQIFSQTYLFHNKKDYLQILPDTLPEEFSTADFFQAGKNAGICLWLLQKAGLIHETKIEKRKKYYTRVK